jgi:hypothetical protein
MNREYFDSIEWLDQVAGEMKAEEWKAFRKLTAEKAKDRGKDKKEALTKPR